MNQMCWTEYMASVERKNNLLDLFSKNTLNGEQFVTHKKELVNFDDISLVSED